MPPPPPEPQWLFLGVVSSVPSAEGGFVVLSVDRRQIHSWFFLGAVDHPALLFTKRVPLRCLFLQDGPVLTNRRLNSRLLRRRLAPRASRELLDPYIRSMPVPTALAGHRALSLKALILTAKSQENTQKSASTGKSHFCALLLRRPVSIWRCCARLATRYCLESLLSLSHPEGGESAYVWRA